MSQTIQSAGINYASPSTVGGTGTTAKIFPSLLNSLSPATLALVQAQNGQQVTVKASGTLFVHGTSPTINFLLQNGTSLTAGSNTTFATLTSVASLTTATQYPFAVKVTLQGDSVSGIVQVVDAEIVCNGVSGAATKTSLTGINFAGPGAAANVVFGVTFGVSDALNTASLLQFNAEE